MKMKSELILDSKFYFSELVSDACKQRNVSARPSVQTYLVNLLNSFLRTDNLFSKSEETGRTENISLAELYLKAVNSPDEQKIKLLKRLGDTTLYLGGFFGDSFKRKIIDLDYYVEMGETAFATLSDETDFDIQSKTYKDISNQFPKLIDVLTLISQKCSIQSSDDILRLYDKYLLIDSDLAKNQLVDLGVLNLSTKKTNKN